MSRPPLLWQAGDPCRYGGRDAFVESVLLATHQADIRFADACDRPTAVGEIVPIDDLDLRLPASAETGP